MTELLLALLAAQCAAIAIWALLKRERLIQYPFLATAVYLGWMLPQFVGLRGNLHLPAGSLDKVLLMAILCLAGLWFGYTLNRRPAALFWWQFDRERLFWGSALLSVAGAFFFYQISLLSPEAGTQWTGVITIYVLFSRMLTAGMIVALILHFGRPSWPTMMILLFDLAFYIDRIVIKGRRAAMVELGLVLLLALWFRHRWVPPRQAIIAMLVVGTLATNSIGEYRATMLGGDQTNWSGAGIGEIFQINFLENLMRVVDGESNNNELTNAAMEIEATDRLLRFDFGMSLWNAFVDAYVPGQWVGYDVKDALMVDARDQALDEFRYSAPTGSTSTGLTDVFQSFWFFGWIKFALIGIIVSRWYRAAMEGSVVGQMIMMFTASASLLAITHHTHWFFLSFVQFAVFLLPVILWARVGTRRSLRASYPAHPQKDRRGVALNKRALE